jgi:membrane protein
LAAWVVPGALLAALLCLVVSWGFSSYVSLFGGFSRTYGSFGALVVLLLWFYFSFFAILLGAELNAELEHELVPDSTADGPDRLGRRGARMADRVAAWEGDGANPPTPGADGRTGAEGRR